MAIWLTKVNFFNSMILNIINCLKSYFKYKDDNEMLTLDSNDIEHHLTESNINLEKEIAENAGISEEEKERLMNLLVNWILNDRKLLQHSQKYVQKPVNSHWHWRLGRDVTI
jgi:hypothetical protein